MLKIMENDLIEVINNKDENGIFYNCKEFVFSGNEVKEVEIYLNNFNYKYRKFSEYTFNYFESYKVYCTNEEEIRRYNDDSIFNIVRLNDFEKERIELDLRKTEVFNKFKQIIFDNVDNNYDHSYFCNEIADFFSDILYYKKDELNQPKLFKILAEDENHVLSINDEGENIFLIIKEKEEESQYFESYRSWYIEDQSKKELNKIINANRNLHNLDFELNPLEKKVILKYLNNNFEKIFLKNASLSLDLYNKESKHDFSDILVEDEESCFDQNVEILFGKDINISSNSYILPDYNLCNNYIIVKKIYDEDGYDTIKICIYRGNDL